MRITVWIAIATLAAGCPSKSGGTDRNEAQASQRDDGQKIAKPAEHPAVEVPPAPPVPPAPAGLPETPSPDYNPTTPEKVALGELLFFDPRMSDKGDRSCATCHDPDHGWSDGEPRSVRGDGRANARQTPTLFNVGYYGAWGWDGSTPRLEEKIMAEWAKQIGSRPNEIVARLVAVPAYRIRFSRAFEQPPSPSAVVEALAAFLRVRTRLGSSPWDRYERTGDASLVSDAARAGFEVFAKRANCTLCHAPPLYTDTRYHNAGVGYRGTDTPDPGRAATTGDPADTGAFKTPTLRGIALHPPYFHDGSAETLEQAVGFMLGGGYREQNPHIDDHLRPLELRDEDRANLLEFLRALSPAAEPYPRPKLP